MALMFKIDPDITIKFILACIPVIVGVMFTGVFGAAFSYFWNIQLKRREVDLALMKAFHELYGEFFAIWSYGTIL